MEETTTPAKTKKSGKNLLIVVAVIILILLAGAGYYFFGRPSSPAAANERDALDLVSRVGRLIDLPKNEKPTVATVTDTAKLADQAFFSKAENGDRVLIYPNNREAILYRPTTNKIINLTNSVNVGQNPTPSAVAPAVSTAPSVSVSPTAAAKPSAAAPTKTVKVSPTTTAK